MDAAVAVILNDFSAIHRSDQENHLNAWAGFVLHEIHYVSDERSRDRFETYGIHYGYGTSFSSAIAIVAKTMIKAKKIAHTLFIMEWTPLS